MAGPTHRVQRVELRSVWPHEQHDFSQWLIKNIDFLNEQLPFELDPDSLEPESAAGDFSVDIVGDAVESASGEPMRVIIENQLTISDHDHLGKVLTYVAGHDARAAIWITAKTRPEHAKAVQWLNDEVTNFDAWLFDIEVIRIANSPPAPLLTQIVGPSELSRRAKAGKQASAVDQADRERFWTVALPKVIERCRPIGVWQSRKPHGSVHFSHTVPGAPGPIRWQMWVTSSGSWICLKVDGETPEEAGYYFKQLLDQRTEIENDFGEKLQWNPLETARASAVRWDNPQPGGFREHIESWEEATNGLADAMFRLVTATKERVQDLEQFEMHDGGSIANIAVTTQGNGGPEDVPTTMPA